MVRFITVVNYQTITTINDLCNILGCGVADIVEHIPDDKPFREK